MSSWNAINNYSWEPEWRNTPNTPNIYFFIWHGQAVPNRLLLCCSSKHLTCSYSSKHSSEDNLCSFLYPSCVVYFRIRECWFRFTTYTKGVSILMPNVFDGLSIGVQRKWKRSVRTLILLQQEMECTSTEVTFVNVTSIKVLGSFSKAEERGRRSQQSLYLFEFQIMTKQILAHLNPDSHPRYSVRH